MSIWHIVEGAAGKMCVVPDGPLLNGRKALKSFACNGLLDAVKILKENERECCADRQMLLPEPQEGE